MISGTLLDKAPPWLLVETAGIGYEIAVPMSTYYLLPELGQGVTLFTHQVVREDVLALYGFAAKKDREIFRELIRTTGVGPKLALAILSSLEVDQLIGAVHDNNTHALVKVPGVGKKTAERLLIELRDRFASWTRSSSPTKQHSSFVVHTDPETEALGALVALGFKPQEASRALAGIDCEGKNSETLIRLALKGMG